ncbi:MAG: hypothetical protein FWH18_02130 [Marinilabiliaceae bacterium]|nr:hypothetical protein [Marinilabiliaceae bacterium]
MQAYKFDTKVSENGAIFLPYLIPNLYGREVELFIIHKEEKSKATKETSAKNFVSRWAGFLKGMNIDTEDAKYNYLSEKYK